MSDQTSRAQGQANWPPDTLADAHCEIADLRAEVDHWKRVALDPEIALEPRNGGVNVVFRHAMCRIIAEEFGAMLCDAPNYVAMDVHHPVHGRLAIIVQRASGKAPHQLAAEYRARLEAMGVTDLAPLPPVPELWQPNQEGEPHLWVNAIDKRVECRRCGGTAPCETPMSGELFGATLQLFAADHRACAEVQR